VRYSCIRVSLLSLALGLSAAILSGQTWNAATQARGWAKQDKDDSFTFYDPSAKVLQTWTRDGGSLGSLSLARLEEVPERWLLDPRNNAWVAYGATMTLFDKTGRNITSLKLPAEVGDVCWDPKGFVISFRSPEPYLEKRDFKTNALLWSFGAKPVKGEGPAPQERRPILMNDAGNVLMADGRSLNLSVLDGNTGRKLSETVLKLASGGPAPTLEGNVLDRGPLALWPGKSVVFAAVTAAQVPATERGTLQGLVLARLDLAQATLEFLATGLDETHVLVGVLDSDAVFASPRGGLLLVKVR
jgi:hypothetical protein